MIRGKYVRLRAVEPEDLRRATDMLNDPAVSIPLGAHFFGISLREEEKWYENYLKGDLLNSFAVEDLKTGEHIGNCGFNSISWKNRKASIGLFLGKEHWGKGYGTDVLMALCHYGFTQLNLQRIQLFVFANHTRGIRAYEKCGFQIEVNMRQNAYTDGQYVNDYIMGVLVEEFLPIYEKYMGE